MFDERQYKNDNFQKNKTKNKFDLQVYKYGILKAALEKILPVTNVSNHSWYINIPPKWIQYNFRRPLTFVTIIKHSESLNYCFCSAEITNVLIKSFSFTVSCSFILQSVIVEI